MGRKLLGAVGRTPNIVVAGVGAVAAVATQSVPVALLGLATWAALLGFDALSPEKSEAPPVELPDPRSLRDANARRACEALRASRAELRELLRKSPGSVQRYGALALASLPELERHAVSLLNRADELGAYLDTVKLAAVRADRDRLRQQASATSDPAVADELLKAAANRDEQLRTLGELGDAYQRLTANLSRIVTTVQALPARVVHLRTLDAESADTASGHLNEELDRMNAELGAFEETLKSMPLRERA